ncbi:MAG: P pilus assembly protein, chaperone PapD [Thermus sp.]|uniref:P pilus assembly protein, chaperone PapD n=1 Tax=Thermus sp. TaxID=275 RepID=UPI0025CE9F86|nr:P pilus assembly protein, chaperone PapD [Thermus sp.]MCS7218315.1 P pilus assembly protein, chaperone PapD [Thermus sp.]MCX7849088.1 P pilus assembly protein, chaperone PapD [Thermus sp.]
MRKLLPLLLSLLPLAQAQTGVGVSPPRALYPASPGSSLTGTVAVDHPGRSGTLQVEVLLQDVLLQPDGRPLYLDPGSHPRSLARWLSVTPLAFFLQPQGVQEVRYTLQVPPGVQPGTYWGVIFFESAPAGGRQGGEGIGIRVRARVGHVVYVEVGQVSRSGRIQGFRYQPPGGDAPAQVRLVFQNTGTGLLRLKGRVEVRDLQGRPVAQAEVPETASLPGATHEIPAPLAKALEPGRYLVLAVLDYGNPNLIAGEGRIEVR